MSADTKFGANRRIRIVHVVFSLQLGGLETGLINLLSNLDPREFEHRIYCMKDLGPNTEKARALGVEVEKVGELHGKNRDIIFRLAKRFREFRPDIVHSRNFGTVDAILAAKLAMVRRRIHGEHGWDTMDLEGTNRKRRFIRGCLSTLVHRYITVSDHLRVWLYGHRGFFKGKVQTIHNGVDTDRYVPTERKSRIRSKITFGTAGRFVLIKDQALLIDAFAPLAREFKDAELILFGDGPLRQDLEERARAKDLGDRIRFPGMKADMRSAYDELDVFVLPSINEGISNTILEAMAAGLPVVASNVGGNPELVMDHESGRLVPKQDVSSLTDALKSYAASRQLVIEHGFSGRTRAIKCFSLQQMAGSYRRTYREVLGLSDAAELDGNDDRRG